MIRDMEFEEYAKPKPEEIAQKAADFLEEYGAGYSDFFKEIPYEESKKRWIDSRAEDIRQKNEEALKDIVKMIKAVSDDNVPGVKEQADKILLELDKYMGKVPGIYDMPITEAATLDLIFTSKGGMGFYVNMGRYITDREYSKFRALDNMVSNDVRYALTPSIAILQLREGEEYIDRQFTDMITSAESLESSQSRPNCEDYELIYVRHNDTDIEADPIVADREENAPLFQDTLNDIYAEFNADTLRPSNYYGHSVSVGDIIVISADDYNNDLYAFYVNSKGFTMLPQEFLSMEMKVKIYNRIDIKQESLLFERIERFAAENSMHLMGEKAEKRYSQIKDNYSDIFKMAERRQMITDMDRLGFEPVMGKHSDGLLRWDQKGYASDEEEAALVVDSWEGVRDFIDEVRALTKNYTSRELQEWPYEDFDVAVWAALMNYPHPEETFKLTGHEISSELRDVLEELAVGRYVTLEKINECPEIILANTIVSDSKPTMLLAGRDDLRKHILEELNKKGAAGIASDGSVCYNKEVIRESRLDIIVGLPGSGKSSALADVISQEFNSRIIDSDEAKKLLPEYNNGWGAGIVHNESKLISDTQLKESMLKGENIVLPRVGGNYKVIDQIVSMAQQLGYSVYMHYVELSREKALGRMLDRFINTGRFMAPEIIDKYDNSIDGNKIEKTYEYFKKGGNINGYSKWNNDVGRGERPILIEQNGCSGRFILSAEQAVNVQCSGGHGTYGTRGLDDGISASGTYAKTRHENNREDIQKSSGGTRQEDGNPDEREQHSERGGTAGEGAPFSGSGYGRDSESYGAGAGTLSRRRGR